MNLQPVQRFAVPQLFVERTEEQLRKAGGDGRELFVIWTGRVDGDTFEVLDGQIPRQMSSSTRDGLLVHIDGDALHRLNVWLYENEQVLGVQIHAHPTDAFHSSTDDTFPVVTTLGGLSIVAADFCRHGLLDASSAAYRLGQYGWDEAPLGIVEVV